MITSTKRMSRILDDGDASGLAEIVYRGCDGHSPEVDGYDGFDALIDGGRK
jgi:hypothetical protein